MNIFSLISGQPFRLSSPYQPVFTDGWAPSITEPDLIGIISSLPVASESEHDSEHELQQRPHSLGPPNGGVKHPFAGHRPPPQYGEDSDEYEESGNMVMPSQHVTRGKDNNKRKGSALR